MYSGLHIRTIAKHSNPQSLPLFRCHFLRQHPHPAAIDSPSALPSIAYEAKIVQVMHTKLLEKRETIESKVLARSNKLQRQYKHTLTLK